LFEKGMVPKILIVIVIFFTTIDFISYF